ncbi:MAG: hypothetical protein GY754_38215 [bacterium]|nr:hypothetical protein [bacterium]
MKRILKPFTALVLMVILQIFVYSIFIKPHIISWGASTEEFTMSLSGDSLSPNISATRAITINAPAITVWHWIIQLGADRGGFFSYSFIEKALGYKQRIPEKPFPEFTTMEKGRVIPGSLDNAKTIIDYSWLVMLVKPGEEYVLENWGTFAVKPIDENRTRLIIRTQGKEARTLTEKLNSFIMVPLHYIMERRMMMDFKACAETGQHLSSTADVSWFALIILSFAGIVFIAFAAKGVRRFLLCSGLGLLWLMPLLVFEPGPLYCLPMLVLVIVVYVSLLRNKQSA